MTTPPITDEEITAVIDGEADESLVARVDADPVAQQRLRAMRAAGDALRSTPPPELDPTMVDTLIGRAIAEGQRTDATLTPHDADPATVTPIAPSRSSSGSGPRWLAAATIVVLVAVGLALVWSGTRGSDEDTASVASTQVEAPADRVDNDGAASATPEAPANQDNAGQSNESSVASPAALGTFATIDDLREALRDEFPARTPSTADIAQAPDAIERCDLLMQEVFSLPGAARAVGVAEVDGTDLIVYEYDAPSQRDGSPTTFVTANEPDSCEALLSFERSNR